MDAHRPVIMGAQHAIATGHYFASQAGFEILNNGGNAIDAGVTAGLAIGVLQRVVDALAPARRVESSVALFWE